jgi:hypothetical protein
MLVNNDLFDIGADIYYDPLFRVVLESHMGYFREKARTIDVDPQSAVVYDSDLFGYLNAQNILPQNHWLTMRVNGFSSPNEFTSQTTSLKLPAYSEVEQIRQSHTSQTSISI